jgi:hypothetical protein
MSGCLFPNALGRSGLWELYRHALIVDWSRLAPLAQHMDELQQAGANLPPFSIGETAIRDRLQRGLGGSL